MVTIYSLCPKLYDVLGISHILRNVINIVWKRDVMGKINARIERREIIK